MSDIRMHTNLTKWYSVNVTGTATTTTESTEIEEEMEEMPSSVDTSSNGRHY